MDSRKRKRSLNLALNEVRDSSFTGATRLCVGCDEEPGNVIVETSALVLKMFQEVTGITEENGNSSLCRKCQHELKRCYTFRKRCLEIKNLYENASLDPGNIVQTEIILLKEPPLKVLKDESKEIVDLEGETKDWIEAEQWDVVDKATKRTVSSKEGNKATTSTQNADSSKTKKRYQCFDCEKSYDDAKDFRYHQAAHANLKNFVCPRKTCTSAFNVQKRLIFHLRTVHKASEREVKETREANQYVTPFMVRNPLQGCETKLPTKSCTTTYTSDGSGKVFASPAIMKKRHQCTFCPCSFTGQEGLQTHLRRVHQLSELDIYEMFLEYL